MQALTKSLLDCRILVDAGEIDDFLQMAAWVFPAPIFRQAGRKLLSDPRKFPGSGLWPEIGTSSFYQGISVHRRLA